MSNRNSNITNYLLPHISKYRLSEEIGSGAYGVVYKGLREDDGKIIALKRIYVTDNDGNNNIPLSTHRELSALKKLNMYENQNIVRLFDVVLNKIEGKVCMDLIFELGDYDLEKYLKKFNSPEDMPLLKIINLSKQLLDAIHFMHSYCVIHRDLKPANILINRNGTDLKITDFGLARTLGFDANLTPVVVTLWYRSPEILLQRSYLTACDVWSAGCIVAEMIYGRPVFAGENELSQIDKIVMRLGAEAIDNWPEDNMIDVESLRKLVDKSRSLDCILKRVDKPMIKLVKKLLRFDPDQRILSSEALIELADIERSVIRQMQSISVSITDSIIDQSFCNVRLPTRLVHSTCNSNVGHRNTRDMIDFDNEMIVNSVVRHVLDDDSDSDISSVSVNDGVHSNSDSEDSNSEERVTSETAMSAWNTSKTSNHEYNECEQTLVRRTDSYHGDTSSSTSTDSIGRYPRHLQVEIRDHDYCAGSVKEDDTDSAVANGNDEQECLHRHHDDYGGGNVLDDDDTDVDENIGRDRHDDGLAALSTNEATDSFSSYRSTNRCSISSYAPSSCTGVGSADEDEHEPPHVGIGALSAKSQLTDEDDQDQDEIDQIHEFQTGVVISDQPKVDTVDISTTNVTDDESDSVVGRSPLTEVFHPSSRLTRVNSTPLKEINTSTDIGRHPTHLDCVSHHGYRKSISSPVIPSHTDTATIGNRGKIIQHAGGLYSHRKRILHPEDSSDGSDENELVLSRCSPIAPVPGGTETKASLVRRQKSLRRRVSLLGSHVPIDENEENDNGQASPLQRRMAPLRAKSVLIPSIPETDELRDISFGEHSLARVLDSIGPTKLSDRPKIVVRRRSHLAKKN